MAKFGIKIMPRQVLLDTQGRAVEQSLKLNQMPVESCRVGRYIELEIEGSDALSKAKKIAETVLHNPLIESFEVSPL
jgi:phosphoribosylformylglycinamidine (FGAM) synthase PurS component